MSRLLGLFEGVLSGSQEIARALIWREVRLGSRFPRAFPGIIMATDGCRYTYMVYIGRWREKGGSKSDGLVRWAFVGAFRCFNDGRR